MCCVKVDNICHEKVERISQTHAHMILRVACSRIGDVGYISLRETREGEGEGTVGQSVSRSVSQSVSQPAS